MNSNSQRVVVNIDWLSFNIVMNELPNDKRIRLEKKQYGTKVYKYIYEIFLRNKLVAELAWFPLSPIIRENSGIIKFANDVLYSENRNYIVMEVLELLRCEPLGYSRVDVCVDFQQYIDIDSPEDLIKMFLRNEIKKIGRGTFQVIGVQKEEHTYNYISFGKRDADVRVYNYNKSQEFRDVKRKLYIEKIWQKAGFDQNKDVWRIEISLTGKSFNLVNTISGEMYGRIGFNFLEQNCCEKLLWSFLDKYFRFVKNSGNARKDRECRIKLFEYKMSEYRIVAKTDCLISGKSEKMLLTRLNKYIEEKEANRESNCDRERILLREIEKRTGNSGYITKKRVRG